MLGGRLPGPGRAWAEAAEPVDQRHGVGVPGGGDRGERPRRDPQPGDLVDQVSRRRGRSPSPCCSGRTARKSVTRRAATSAWLRSSAPSMKRRHRHRQHRGVPEDRDQLAHRDAALDREPGGQPHDHSGEQRRQAQTDCLDHARDATDPVAVMQQPLRLGAETVGVDGFAAQPVQDAQPRDDVDDPARHATLLLAVRRTDRPEPARRRDRRPAPGPGPRPARPRPAAPRSAAATPRSPRTRARHRPPARSR